MAKPPNRAIPVERPGVDHVAFTAQSERVERTLRGPHRFIKGFVAGLVGADNRRLWSATFADGIPDLGALDTIAEGAVLGRISAEQRKDSPGQAEVELEYGFFAEDDFVNDPGTDPELAQVEVISTVVPVVTHIDVHGKPMILKHEFLVRDEEGQVTDTIRGPDQIAELEYHLPNHVVIFRRREANSPGSVGVDGQPGNKSKDYVGTINGDDVTVFGDPKHMWMCTRLDGRSGDGGLTWMVTYEFQRNEDSWNPTAVYRDPKTGAPVFDATIGSLQTAEADPVGSIFSQRPFQLYRATNFHALRLEVDAE